MAGNECRPEAGVKGVVEGVKGKAKEAVGAAEAREAQQRSYQD
jgi:hypothetical protein